MLNLEKIDSVEDIARSLEFLDEKTLRETLAYILKIYVIDKDVSYEGVVSDFVSVQASPVTVTSSSSPGPQVSSFGELLKEMKRKYSFNELDLFTIENNNIYININGKKHQIPSRAQGVEIQNRKVENISKPSSDVKDNGEGEPGRFKNLEMD